MPLFSRREIDDDFDDNSEALADANDYLSDIFDCVRRIEEQNNERLNQGDKQVEFLSRLVTLFETAEREARMARKAEGD